MRIRRRDLPLVLGAVAGLFLTETPPARAIPSLPQRPKDDPPPLPNTFGELISRIAWSPDSDGPLMIVAPEKAPLNWDRLYTATPDGNASPVPLPMPDASGKYSIEAVASFYDCQLLRSRDLSVVTPITMAVLNWRNLPKINEYSDLDSNTRFQLLMSGLQRQQLKKLGSKEGLGLGDLNPRQQELFLSLLEPNAKIDVTTVSENTEEATQQFPVTEQIRQNMRLKLEHRFIWELTSQDSDSSIGIGISLNPGEKQILLRTETNMASSTGWHSPNNYVCGALIREFIPNKLKQGDLSLGDNQMSQPISLANLKTVGELIARIADAISLELHCDVRYRDLTLHLRGDSAHVGDLLQSICLAVTATFRKVGPCYLLTDDRVGLAVRHLEIREWAVEARQVITARDLRIATALKAANWQQYVDWDRENPQTPSDAILSQFPKAQMPVITSADSKRDRDAGLVSVADLPEAAQKAIQRQIDYWDKLRAEETNPNPAFERKPLRSDKVRPHPYTSLSIILPGLGKADMTTGMGAPIGPGVSPNWPEQVVVAPLQGIDTKPPVVTLPPTVKERALIIRPASAEEIERAAKSVRAASFQELWIEILPDQVALAQAAASAAKANQIKCRAIVRLLRAGKTTPASHLDRNVRGETSHAIFARRAAKRKGDALTGNPDIGIRNGHPYDPAREQQRQVRLGDWLRWDIAEVPEQIRRSIAQFAGVTGLHGVVLHDIAAPGYEEWTRYQNHLHGQLSNAAEDLGYSEAMRVAFLRKHGVDPIDISPFGDNFNPPNLRQPSSFFQGTLPFFPDLGPGSENGTYNNIPGNQTGSHAAFEKWSRFRSALARSRCVTLVNDLLPIFKDRPIYMATGPDDPRGFGEFWFRLVDNPLSLPPSDDAAPPATENPPGAPGAKAPEPATSFRAIRFYPAPPPRQLQTDFLFSLSRQLQRANPSDENLALDLSGFSVPVALELLALFPKDKA